MNRHHSSELNTPIHQSHITVFDSFDGFRQILHDKCLYGRSDGGSDNETVRAVERLIAQLENGDMTVCYGSGMAAISNTILSCLKAGDHIVSVRNIYSPSYHFFKTYLPRFGIETTFVTGLSLSEIEAMTRPNTRMLYLESPTSLTFQLQDLQEIARLAKQRGIITAIDSSWATPVFLNPLDHGIDLVIHSASKYLSGHSDVAAGVLVGKKDNARHIPGRALLASVQYSPPT